MPSVHYLSHHDTVGYGVAGRRLVLGLEAIGCPVRWTPLDWSDSGPLLADDKPSAVGLDRLRNVRLSPDLVIAHTLPEWVPALEQVRQPGVAFVLHTVWEHEVLQPHWPALINRCDAVIVPTQWNAAAFRDGGVRVPVLVVPHATAGTPSALDAADEAVDQLGDEPSDDAWLADVYPSRASALALHSVATWSLRKAPWTTLEAYARAFTAADDVTLAMRTTAYLGHDVPVPAGPATRRDFTSWSAAAVLARHAPAPAVHLVTDALTFGQLDALHRRSDGWVSLPRCEGWDLGCFDAAVAGCPVITTGYGGPLEYLDPALSTLIPGELVDAGWLPGARWMQPDVDAAVQALRALREDPGAARDRAGRQAVTMRERFAPPVVAAGLVQALRDSGLVA